MPRTLRNRYPWMSNAMPARYGKLAEPSKHTCKPGFIQFALRSFIQSFEGVLQLVLLKTQVQRCAFGPAETSHAHPCPGEEVEIGAALVGFVVDESLAGVGQGGD